MKLDTKCPVCSKELESINGTQLNPNDGITVYCPNIKCGMADWGHGKDTKSATIIFIQKCGKSQ